MIYCAVAGCMLSILSIFTFFGNVVSGLKEPTMFQYMCGFIFNNDSILSFNFGYFFMFILQLIITGLAIFIMIRIWKENKKSYYSKKNGIFFGIMITLCFIVALLGLSSASMSTGFTKIINLGPGPEFYATFQFISAALFGAAFFRLDEDCINDTPKPKKASGYLAYVKKQKEEDNN